MRVLLVSSWETACGITPETLAARIRVLPPRKLPTGCWRWAGVIDKRTGYTLFTKGRKSYRAHTLVYKAVKGCGFPPGLIPDHLCRRRWCVNPDHLEVVTVRVNTLRGRGPSARNARKVRCKRGHQLSGDNVYLKPGKYGPLRVCVACRRVSGRRYERERRLRLRG